MRLGPSVSSIVPIDSALPMIEGILQGREGDRRGQLGYDMIGAALRCDESGQSLLGTNWLTVLVRRT
jgi:hypothetical protein